MTNPDRLTLSQKLQAEIAGHSLSEMQERALFQVASFGQADRTISQLVTERSKLGELSMAFAHIFLASDLLELDEAVDDARELRIPHDVIGQAYLVGLQYEAPKIQVVDTIYNI